MKNILDTYLQDNKFPVFEYVTGEEKLSFPEHVKMWLTDIYSFIQKIYSKFTFNIHKVDMSAELSVMVHDASAFYKHGSVFCPTPEYFVKSPQWMVNYVKALADTAVLMDILNTEASTMYSRMKKFAASGVAPIAFKWVVTDTDKVIQRAEVFMRGLKQNRGSYKLKEVYGNTNEMIDVVNKYNQIVSNFKSRDAEMLNNELKRVYDISSLIAEKLRIGDIPTNEDEIRGLESMFKTFAHLTNVTGAMLVLLNEMSAVMDDTRQMLRDLA
ncbi:hypothetical protein [Shewanella phage FishSpeaker]|nr:hypothetical protein [Shewanella phage FishSpeaker]